jgi:hypothetical protein
MTTKTKKLQWSRSEDGNTMTKCGRFCIDSLHSAYAQRPYAFELYEHDYYFARQVRRGRFTLQRDAKWKAEYIASK